MFDRAAAGIIAAAAACAAAAMTVFALGFALYAWTTPYVGVPGAAAIVALVGALIAALYALFTAVRARRREREAELAQAALVEGLPHGFAHNLGDIARDRPLVALAVTLAGGALAARHPRLARDLVTLAARFFER